MARGTAFAEMLDEKLDGYDRHAAPPPRAHLRVATWSHYWLEQQLQAPVARVAPGVTRNEPTSAPGATASDSTQPIESLRVPRTLSMKQQEALDALIRLGARLERDFTDDELRSVFRTLALRYHPDRHVNSGAAERQRLSMLFARAVAAYELLKTATPRIVH